MPREPANAQPIVISGTFDPQLLDVLQWSPLDEQCRDPKLREDLRRHVDELPEAERTILEALFWERISKRQLARRLGVDRSSVNTLYRRAMEHLRVALLVSD